MRAVPGVRRRSFIILASTGAGLAKMVSRPLAFLEASGSFNTLPVPSILRPAVAGCLSRDTPRARRDSSPG